MLKYRVASGLIMGAAVIAAALWLPGWGILLVLVVVCALAMIEFYRMLDAAGIPHFKYLGGFWGIAIIAATWWCAALGRRVFETGALLLPVVVGSVFLRLFPQKFNPRPLVTVASTLLGILYIPTLFNFMTKLLWIGASHEGRIWAMYAIVVVKMADIGAYTVGCSIGRHKLIPRISPAKTWEGCAGAVGFAVLASVAYAVLIAERFIPAEIGLGHAVSIGVVVAVAGILGDLTESLFKRSAGVKDSGVWISGMGGVLDVIDSLLFAAPALYIYLRLFLRGSA